MSEKNIKPLKKVMVANRGEIAIRVFRACTELGIKTVAVYSGQDRLQLHRYKADEAYFLEQKDTAKTAYLDADQLIEIAREKGVQAIHPGYGFLAENAEFAKKCIAANIIFIGPPPEVLDAMGDKVAARHIAEKAKVPIIPGTKDAVEKDQDALLFAKEYGFPLIIKAAHGGGGRGMTIVHNRDQLLDAIHRSRVEAKTSFGSAKIFLERYLEHSKHIEIQVVGDHYGNLYHFFERDCSIQRRYQKVIEIAPSLHLSQEIKERLYEDALKICRTIQYQNAGTVEFLVDSSSGQHYFIEVNPRIQVEHTITEIITGRDLVQMQIRIAQGYEMSHDTIRISSQSQIKKSGYAIQCRITTEDPRNNFAPDTGKITTFRAGEGFGIRLDSGSGFEGAVITPHYDSLLVKLCAWGLDFDQATSKALRAIREFRIRGVATNIPFLENVLKHPIFQSGECNTNFVEKHTEIFTFVPKKDRANKLLRYLADICVNSFKGIDPNLRPTQFFTPIVPKIPETVPPTSPAYQIFEKQGATGLSKWLLEQKKLLLTDTTLRDAHQSLIATRMRSFDMYRVAHATAHLTSPYFSQEMWGGATFDVALRFLHECPWERLRILRTLMPGTLLQVLVRSGNAVGYTNYPDNIVHRFIELSAKNGIDVFRIFDSLNWIEGMKPSIESVLKTGKIAEAAICYSGDITDSKRRKFTLNYYIKQAKELEKTGAHILGIKDMAGLLKPEAARILITELKNTISIPIHLHTHDTSGNGVASLLEASKAGVDIVDAAISSMSGVTSQPSLNAIVCALQGTERDTGVDPVAVQQLADYWEIVREAYAPFECGLKAGTADVYRHEIPGGQYSNFRPQAVALGLGDRWEDVKNMFRTVNDMLGDIIKVTPSSKAVGDMALFMVQNNLTPEEVLRKGKDMAFPDSFVSLMKGMMGQSDDGFPPEIQKVVLKGIAPITCRPGELLEDFDFEKAATLLKKKFSRDFGEEDLVSYALYPQVFLDYCERTEEYGNLSVLDTPTFFYGLGIEEEKSVTIEEGKTLIVKLLAIGELQEDGTRELFFELNGRSRNVTVRDIASGVSLKENEKASPENSKHISAPMRGKVMEIFVKEGDSVKESQKLLSTEAMKMLNVVVAPNTGTIKRILFATGEEVSPGDLVVELA